MRESCGSAEKVLGMHGAQTDSGEDSPANSVPRGIPPTQWSFPWEGPL